MGSDGVFDNLFDDQIKDCLKAHKALDEMADCIATYAEFVSYQNKYISPYTSSAVAHGLKEEDNLGGKPDDITVIVSKVCLNI